MEAQGAFSSSVETHLRLRDSKALLLNLKLQNRWMKRRKR